MAQRVDHTDISDVLRQILDICASMPNLRSGAALPISAFLHQGINQGLNGPDIHDAVVEGAGLGWFELDDRKIYMLTDAGASAISEWSTR